MSEDIVFRDDTDESEKRNQREIQKLLNRKELHSAAGGCPTRSVCLFFPDLPNYRPLAVTLSQDLKNWHRYHNADTKTKT